MKFNLNSGRVLCRELQCLSQTIEDMRGVYRHVEPMSMETPHYVSASSTRRIANTGHSALTVARLRNSGGSPILLEER